MPDTPVLHQFSGVEVEAPRDLVTSEETHHSFRVSWTAPDSSVDKYRVIYTKVAGGPIQEVRLSSLLSLLI